jgi:hypothetical protein
MNTGQNGQLLSGLVTFCPYQCRADLLCMLAELPASRAARAGRTNLAASTGGAAWRWPTIEAPMSDLREPSDGAHTKAKPDPAEEVTQPTAGDPTQQGRPRLLFAVNRSAGPGDAAAAAIIFDRALAAVGCGNTMSISFWPSVHARPARKARWSDHSRAGKRVES